MSVSRELDKAYVSLENQSMAGGSALSVARERHRARSSLARYDPGDDEGSKYERICLTG